MTKTTADPAWLAKLGEMFLRVSPGRFLMLITVVFLSGTLLAGLGLIQGPWQAKRKTLSSRYADELRRGEILGILRNSTKQLEGLESEILLKGETPALTGEITRLAAQLGLDVQSVAPRDPVPLDPYQRLQIEVVATSAFRNLILFLNALEGHRPCFFVNELEMSQAADTGGESSPQEPRSDQPLHHQIRLVITALAMRQR